MNTSGLYERLTGGLVLPKERLAGAPAAAIAPRRCTCEIDVGAAGAPAISADAPAARHLRLSPLGAFGLGTACAPREPAGAPFQTHLPPSARRAHMITCACAGDGYHNHEIIIHNTHAHISDIGLCTRASSLCR